MVLPIVLAGGALVAMMLAAGSSKAAPAIGRRLCDSPPPTPQPPFPAGFRIYRGPVDNVSSFNARGALSQGIGHFEEYRDESNRQLGILISWHCHEPESGLKPVGWHKGANILERVATT